MVTALCGDRPGRRSGGGGGYVWQVRLPSTDHPPVRRHGAPGFDNGAVWVQGGGGRLDYRKSTLARGSRWDYTPLPF